MSNTPTTAAKEQQVTISEEIDTATALIPAGEYEPTILGLVEQASRPGVLAEVSVIDPYTVQFVSATMACNHFSVPIYAASSTWDFMEDGHVCSQGCESTTWTDSYGYEQTGMQFHPEVIKMVEEAR